MNGFYNTENWPEKSTYYRWPWSSNDNPVAWLEITDLCNIHCRGCYRSTLSGHRDLEVLEKEVDFHVRLRNIDTVCIAGGEPLVYPHIVELVRRIAARGLKPNIVTNTHAMTRDIVRDLYRAGLYGFTCHIDMLQSRPENPDGKRNELDLMPLREEKARLIHEAGRGRIYTTFNFTVYHENFKYIPDLIRWARSNAKYVCGLDFITYRGIPIEEGVTWDATEDEPAAVRDVREKLGYVDSADQVDITSVDVYNLIKDHFGDKYEPCAYLGGTGHVNDYKWWGEVSLIDTDGYVYGPVGRRTMEFLQVAHHWSKGRYFMYLSRSNRVGRIPILLTALLGDKSMRPVRRRLLLRSLNPAKWFRRLYNQSIGINQPPDMMENGMPNMCESCPDACVWEGNLVSSCRLDEYRRYGRLLNAIVHRDKEVAAGFVPNGETGRQTAGV
jgi:MoaA/NifB/PqqE/SkfB family radical SAM enzyme